MEGILVRYIEVVKVSRFVRLFLCILFSCGVTRSYHHILVLSSWLIMYVNVQRQSLHSVPKTGSQADGTTRRSACNANELNRILIKTFSVVFWCESCQVLPSRAIFKWSALSKLEWVHVSLRS